MQTAKKRALEKKLKRLHATATNQTPKTKYPAPGINKTSKQYYSSSRNNSTESNGSWPDQHKRSSIGFGSDMNTSEPKPTVMSSSAMNVDQQEAYPSSNEEEDIEDYKKGGYHSVTIGEEFKNHRYKIVRKLGWGHFSTVWLAYDKNNDCHVALKIVKSASHYTDAARDEIKLCERAANTSVSHIGHNHVIQLLDSFEHSGPNGIHVCMVFEVLGENLLFLLRNAKKYSNRLALKPDQKSSTTAEHGKTSRSSSSGFESEKSRRSSNNTQGLPIYIVKQIAKDVLKGLAYLHGPCRMIHTDLKPENVLVCINNVEQVIRKELEKSSINTQIVDSDIKMEEVSDTPEPEKISKNVQTQNNSEKNHDNSLVRNIKGINIDESDKSITSTFIDESQKEKHVPEKKVSEETLDNTEKPKPKQEFTLQVKLADLGNATWIERHFTEDIQTRQYRSPEVIIGAEWNASADVWSCACLIFELLTGDYLFEPRSGEDYDKDEDHLAQIMETIAPFSKKFALSGRYSSEFFNRKGELRHIKRLKPYPLKELLHKEYGFTRAESSEISQFLRPMLDINPLRRASSLEMLDYKWLKDV
ncbi:hypothetical protein BB559_006751 [Furculomyces boomerangus]|uniref:non-specific serine/threonine protein kinase n=2 Tax=Harpellales TaxID=61421 RepID=A0A2T9Y0V9_9FUNG|nr:hypothetical protein BB559_006793 [Furculomyces boomerangus]PVU85947.1 hypothetical protein BB559_006751 [Furculomyces boomerangus]PWA03170.1 hypothetical protein BB558_000665 [Smittium angustum]